MSVVLLGLLCTLRFALADEGRKRPDLTGVEEAYVVEGDVDIILGEGAPTRDGFLYIPLLVNRPAGPMTIRVQGRGFVPLVAAVGPKESTWIEGDPDTGLAQAWFYPEVPDEWLIVVTSMRPGQVGTFSLTVLDTAPNPMAPDRKAGPGRLAPVELPAPGAYGFGPFYATRFKRTFQSGALTRGVWATEILLEEGDQLQVTASGLQARGWRAWVELQAPDGTVLRGEEVAGWSNSTRFTGAVPKAGKWTILVRTPPVGSWPFELDLQILGKRAAAPPVEGDLCAALSYAMADARLLHRPSRGGELIEGVDPEPGYAIPGALRSELRFRSMQAVFLDRVDPMPQAEPFDGLVARVGACVPGWTREASDWTETPGEGGGWKRRRVTWQQPGLDEAPSLSLVQEIAPGDGSQQVELIVDAP